MKPTYRKVYRDSLLGEKKEGVALFLHKGVDPKHIREVKGIKILEKAYHHPEEVLPRERLEKLHSDIRRQKGMEG